VRYHLIVLAREGESVLRIFDRQRRRLLMDLEGPAVQTVLNCPWLPAELRTSGCHPCGRDLVCHLLMAGAAARSAWRQLRVAASR
jgi:hypothetical protein